MEMTLDKKQIRAIFLLTCNINNTFGLGTPNEVWWWFSKFCKGDESLEDEECSGWPSEVDNDQLRAITET